MLVRIVAVILLAVIPILSSVTPTAACSCIERSIPEAIESSDGVLVGRIVESESRRISIAGSSNTTPIFENVIEVEAVVKGEFKEKTRVSSPDGAGVCGLPGGVMNGSRHGFYIYGVQDGDFSTNLCSTIDADELLTFAGETAYPPLPVSLIVTEQPPPDSFTDLQAAPAIVITETESTDAENAPAGNGDSANPESDGSLYNVDLIVIVAITLPLLSYGLWYLKFRNKNAGLA